MNLNKADLDYIIAGVTQNLLAQLPSVLSDEKKEQHGKWLSSKEAMIFARVSSWNTFRKLLDEGVIYGKKLGRKWRIDRDSITDYLNSDNFGVNYGR